MYQTILINFSQQRTMCEYINITIYLLLLKKICTHQRIDDSCQPQVIIKPKPHFWIFINACNQISSMLCQPLYTYFEISLNVFVAVIRCTPRPHCTSWLTMYFSVIFLKLCIHISSVSHKCSPGAECFFSLFHRSLLWCCMRALSSSLKEATINSFHISGLFSESTHAMR